MAMAMAMASAFSSTTHTAAAITSLLLLFSASADDKLIELECHNAEVPQACLRCIRSDPAASQADPVGLAAILISCLSSQAHALAANMSDLASRAPDKAVLQTCAKDFLQAQQSLSNANSQLRSRRYDDANHSIRTALENQLYCTADINRHKLRSNIPSAMIYEIRLYQELSDAAMRIIDRF